MKNNPKVSIIVPIHNMADGDKFLWRLVRSLTAQTFKDWELIITEDGKMAENTNAGIMKARGEIIKILYMDDMLYTKDSLQKIVDAFTDDVNWMVVGCVHIGDDNIFKNPHVPYYNDEIETGNNTIGSPSVIAIRNNMPLLFDENLSWLLDCCYYKRMYEKFGLPRIIEEPLVAIGIGDHQTTFKLNDEYKQSEYVYLQKKYGKRV